MTENLTIEERREKVKSLAIDNFKSGLNCAECVYDALIRAGELDVADETRAMAIGFGGGIGLCGLTCGALSAAVMANGAVYGRKDPWQVDAAVRGHEIAEKYYRRYNNLANDFIKQNGSALCREICAPYEDWHCKDRRKMCMKLIGNAAALAFDYLQIDQDKAFAMPYCDGNISGAK